MGYNTSVICPLRAIPTSGLPGIYNFWDLLDDLGLWALLDLLRIAETIEDCWTCWRLLGPLKFQARWALEACWIR